jgi:hypothetical protein
VIDRDPNGGPMYLDLPRSGLAGSGAFIGFGELAMTRATQFTIGRYMIAAASKK